MGLLLPSAAAGLANGLFGGGGGMLLLPSLRRWGDLPEEKLYPTCLGVMAPVCALSAGLHLARQGVPPEALPCLTGGLVGGLLGGRLYRRVPPDLLRRLFALFVIYGGLRFLLG